MSDRTYLSIGQVLDLLKREFPDLTISKIRFLESQGLLDPERTPSGYRKFYEPDIERLRFILRAQQEHYLPLKVIKGRLGSDGEGGPDEAGEGERRVSVAAGYDVVGEAPGGEEPGARPGAAATPPESAGGPARPAGGRPSVERTAGQPAREQRNGGPGSPSERHPSAERPGVRTAPAAPEFGSRRGIAPTATARSAAPGGSRLEVVGGREAPPGGRGGAASHPPVEADESVSLTLEELADAAGLSVADVTELERFGLLSGRRLAGTTYYDGDCLEISRVAAAFRDFGVEARHLRMYRTAVEREAGFFEQVVTPMLKQRNPQARRQAVETMLELSRLGQLLRAAVLRQALRDYTGS